MEGFEWGIVLQQILIVVLNILLPVVLGYAALWIRGLVAQGKAKLTAEQLAIATSFVESFVFAAEQSGLTGTIEDIGEAKKAWVLERVQTALDAQGISIDVEVIADLIEAHVYKSWHDSAPAPQIEA
jgi:hypothetical protein